MKIGVIGGGTVGRATARAFMEHAEVRVYDLVAERRTHSRDEVYECDLVFLCLPTPQQKNSLACDLSAVEYALRGVLPEERDTSLVLRSTVPIGTTKRLREQYGLKDLVHSPEFLTARCAAVDAQLPARNIVGGPACQGAAVLAELYSRRFPGVPLHLMSSDESEAVKLITNGFFAMKVAYLNEVYTLCESLRLSWDAVLAGVLADGRISHSHTRVPGPDGHFGFGGECLVKDLASLIHCIDGAGEYPAVTGAAYARNKLDRERPT